MESAYTKSEKAQIYKESGNNQCYNPPLPTSVQKEEKKDVYDFERRLRNGELKDHRRPDNGKSAGGSHWKPPLPTSVIKDGNWRTTTGEYKPYTVKDSTYGKDLKVTTNYKGRKGSESCYEPPLPTIVTGKL